MKNKKCFNVSFNVGDIEVWGSNLYSNKEAALLETENSKYEIAEQISAFSFKYSDDVETFEMLERAILDLKQYGKFRERENKLDFFILEQPILDHYKQN
ncbi:MAG: hypothetical protein JSS64_08375 [Bacteroidetes bacterium]|nr:hypothetical protein [Bacteroidota bacterium]